MCEIVRSLLKDEVIMSKEVNIAELKGIELTPSSTWKSAVGKALEPISKMVDELSDDQEKEMFRVADDIEQLHAQTLPMGDKDPQRALEVYFEFYRAFFEWYTMILKLTPKEKVQERLESLITAQMDHVKGILLESPPKDVESFAVDFSTLPFYGLTCLGWLDALSEVWGPREMGVVKSYIEPALQTAPSLEEEFEVHEDYNYDGFSYEDRMQMYPDLFLLLQGKVTDFVKTQLSGDEVYNARSLSFLASHKLRPMGLVRGALACAQLIPPPKPCFETNVWYLTCEHLMRELGRLEEARRLRWKFFVAEKDHHALWLYLRPFGWSADSSSPTDAEFFQEIQRIKDHLIKECDFRESLDICVEYRFLRGFEEILDELMMHHLLNFPSYPDKVFEFVVEKYEEVVKAGGDTSSPVAALLAHREIIRRSWKSHYDPNPHAFIDSAAPRHETADVTFFHLNLDIVRLSARLKLVIALESQLKTDGLLPHHFPTHDEFIMSLEGQKKSPRHSSSSPSPPSLRL